MSGISSAGACSGTRMVLTDIALLALSNVQTYTDLDL